jgi:hypothetical protein
VLQEAELSGQADSENDLGGFSETMYYIGLDVHKKTISFCVKDAADCVQQEGKIGSTRRELDAWVRTLPQPRTIAMEATIFTGWIYDHLLPHAERVKVAHPLMLRAIAAAKRKNDRISCRAKANRERLPARLSSPCGCVPCRVVSGGRGFRWRSRIWWGLAFAGEATESGLIFAPLDALVRGIAAFVIVYRYFVHYGDPPSENP